MVQDTAKRSLVAVMSPLTREAAQLLLNAFLQGLRERGDIDGNNIDVVYRFADDDVTRFPALAQNLVALKPDVIVTGTANGALACKHATSIVPIVVVGLVDPVGMGLITSLARPGGNVTGIMYTLEGLPGKLLQLLSELKPDLKTIGLILSINEIQSALLRRATEVAAATMGVTLVPVEVRTRDDFETALETLTQAHVDAVLAPGAALLTSERKDFAARALAARLPTMFSNRELVEAGGLMGYGLNLRENMHRAAYFVDRILKGTKPANLPVEIPTKFELVINLKTAKALGITVPPILLERADEVIE
jgi:putative ABC transport system substrate-binding protein